MDELIEGYRRFRAGRWREHEQRFQKLAREGQKPRSLVIACSDSRVDPQMIFDAGPGDLFVVRNIAALVPSYQPDAAYDGTSAAIEYAVRALEVEQIVIVGHSLCGGIRGLLNASPETSDDFVTGWIAMAASAREALRSDGYSEEERERLVGEEAIKLSLRNLMTFPWVAERVSNGRLKLQGCRFDVATGELLYLDDGGVFAPAPSDAEA